MKKWPDFTFEQIKKRASILVIDDDDFPYQSLFEEDDYKITKWDDVKNLGKLENNTFDIILLDIQGIASEITKDEGLGVLKHIKEKQPSQIVIAYSNADWSLKYQGFFDLADDKISKDVDYTDFKRAVDRQLKNVFSFDYYCNKITDIVDNSIPQKTLKKKIEQSVIKSDPSILETFLRNKRIDSSIVINSINILAQGLTIYAALVGMK